jgi:hypothetical protein
MATYVVVRHGSNAANQSMCQRSVLGFVEAKDRDAAYAECHDRWTCYNNQQFELVSLSRARKADITEANEADWEPAQ